MGLASGSIVKSVNARALLLVIIGLVDVICM